MSPETVSLLLLALFIAFMVGVLRKSKKGANSGRGKPPTDGPAPRAK